MPACVRFHDLRKLTIPFAKGFILTVNLTGFLPPVCHPFSPLAILLPQNSMFTCRSLLDRESA